MQRFGISIGPEEKKPYAKSNSIRDCGSRAVSRHRSDTVRGVHRGERELPFCGRTGSRSVLVAPAILSLPYEPRTITIIQSGE
jgi:hypothetical protein